MYKTLRIISALPALLFLLVGVRWLTTPEAVAAEFGMPLLEGLGRSTQIGDLGAFFVAGSAMVLIGLIKEQRAFLYSATMLISFTAVFRIIAWAAHDAAFATSQIATEVIVTVLLLVTARLMPAAGTN